MAGQDDWEQRTIGDGAAGMSVYVHKLCGALIDMPLTSVHMKSCPAANKPVENV